MRCNGMWKVGGRTQIGTGVWWGNPQGRHHLEKTRRRREYNIETDIKK